MTLVLEGKLGLVVGRDGSSDGGGLWREGRGLDCTKRSTAGVHDQSHDKTIQPKHFSENEDQNHAHKQPRLLRRTTYASITHDANGKTSCQSAQPYAQSSSQVQERTATRVSGTLAD